MLSRLVLTIWDTGQRDNGTTGQRTSLRDKLNSNLYNYYIIYYIYYNIYNI
jgi:hypothetical protein